MTPYKAPSPDGYPSIFYVECWDIIGSSVIEAIQSFFTTGYLLKEFNQTFIVLIPKLPMAVEVTDYRLISLCNLIYKLISKILINHMRPILKRVIAPT